jgi:hypothetical protein
LLCVIDRCATSVCSSCGGGVYSRSSYNSDDGGGDDGGGDDGGGDDGGGCSNDVHPLMLVGLQL